MWTGRGLLITKPCQGFCLGAKVAHLAELIAIRKLENFWIQFCTEDCRDGHHRTKLSDILGAFFPGRSRQVHEQLATIIVQEAG
jgi:hypothetical protein